MSQPYENYPQPPQPPQGWQSQGWQPPPRPPRPATVENAVRLMLFTSLLSLIGIVLTFSTRADLKRRLEQANPSADPQRVDSLLNAAIAVGLTVGIVILVLYVALAFQVRAGRNWARIVTWVFAGLGVLGALGALSSTATPLSRTLSLVQSLIDIAIIVLLALGPSNDYFRKRPVYPG